MRLRAWLLAGALVLPALAFADDAKRAVALFEEGRAFARTGKFTEACAKFDESFKLDPQPGTRLNVADCLERSGKLARALDEFNTAANEFDRASDAERAKFARTRADALKPRLAILVIKIPQTPDKTRVKIGDRALPGAEELRLELDPGPIHITVDAPGRPAFVRDATLVAGATATFEVPVPVVAPPPVATITRRKRGRVHLAFGLAAGGGATLIGTTVIAILAKRQYDNAVEGPECMRSPLVCTEDGVHKINDARAFARVGTVFGIATGVLLGGAAIVYFTAPTEHVIVTPIADSSTVGISFSRGF